MARAASTSRPLLLGGLCLLVAAVGCGRGSFAGRQVDDFRAYYNTFYNAEAVYEEATAPLRALDAPVDPEAYLSVYPGPEAVSDEEALGRVVTKGADVLREHPGSKWIDDALLLIGKAYFYQGNYVGAEQKFREVLARQDEALHAEARFWLARALIGAGGYGEALAHLSESLAEAGEADRRARLHLLRGGVHVREQAWTEAAEALRTGLSAGDVARRPRARAWYLLGQVYEATEAYDRAAAAYAEVQQARPPYELGFAARMSALRARGRSGEAVAAREALRAMARDDKHRARRGEMELLRGELYRMEGNTTQARQIYTALLYGPEPASPGVRGRVHYALGTLYREDAGSFERAAAHFDTAATALEQPSAPGAATGATASEAAPTAITDSRAQADRFARVAAAAERVERVDSLLRLGGMSEDELRAFIGDLRRQRMADLQAARSAEEERERAWGFAQLGGAAADEEEVIAAEATTSETGFLYHRDPVRLQEGRAAFIRRWGQRPLAPDWRRITAVSGAASTTASGELEQQALLEDETLEAAAAALPDIDLSAVPRSAAERAAMRDEHVRARYELANALFLTLNRPDSAIVWYERILDEDPGGPVAQRARYALAEAHRAQGRTQVANTLYRQLALTYPNTALGQQARARLLGDAETLAEDGPVIGEASDRAERLYEQAYRTWQRGAYEEAIPQLIGLAAQYPQAAAAPRALLAAGTAGLEWNGRRGRLPHVPLPVSVPDSLTARGGLLGVATTDLLLQEPETEGVVAGDSASADSVLSASALLRAAIDSLRATGSPDAAVLPRAGAPGREADSLRIPDGRAARGPEGAAGRALRVEAVLAGLISRYPETPYASRARRTLRGLLERRASAAAQSSLRDSEAISPEETARQAPEESAPDADARVPDRSALEAARPDIAATAAGEGGPGAYALRGGTWHEAAGGWTLVVSSKQEARAAEAEAARYRARGYRTGTFPAEVSGQRRYRVGVGQFETPEAARAARAALGAALPGGTWPLHLAAGRN